MTAQTPARPRKKSRRGKFLIITVIVLGVLLVAADFALAAAGEYQIAQRMREKLQLDEDPSVRINGFPFALQALRGDYQHVEIRAHGVPIKDEQQGVDLRDLDIEADLLHTRVELADLLAGNVSKATIDTVKGSIKIKALDLNRLANQVTPFDKLSIEPDNRAATQAPVDPKAPKTTAAIKLSGETNVAGKVVPLTAYGQIALVSGTIQINIDDIELNDASLKQIIPQLRQALAIKIAPGSLPFGATPTAVEVESGAFKLSGEIADVPLDQR
ncbi:LmeA family phospholipid-binding protein [Lentzea sp. E54]|uniref:LmeA family phospholipid-binding protein n=1 Tax=Lentzea xerophila TaxID=3435883 RepID=UPI003DA47409